MKEKIANYKGIFWATLIIGLITHGFCYANIFSGHDAAGLWWTGDFADAAEGTRIFQPLLNEFFYNVRIPWLDGVLTLLFYSVAIWGTCESLHIKNKVLEYLVVGLFITSPTAISSNHYTGYVFAFALMTSCLAVYVYDNVKFGTLWSFILILITANVYASYLNVTIALFLLYSLRCVIIEKRKYFLRQIEMAAITLGAMVVSLAANIKIAEIGNATLQNRVEEAASIEMDSFWELLRNAIDEVFLFFSPEGNISFFQGMPIIYYSFLTMFFVSTLGLIYVIFSTGIYKEITKLFIVIIDIMFIPLAMNMLAVVTTCHYLMTFSFITPWLMAIHILNMIHEHNMIKHNWIAKGYKIVILAVCTVTIIEGGKLANISYIKQYSNYETGIQYANRVVSRIESIDGYIPGKTKVVFVGFSKIGNRQKGYQMLDDLTGIDGTSALTYSIPFIYYIQQRMGVDMNIINGQDYRFGLDECLETFEKMNLFYDVEEILNLDAYPSNKCFLWLDDVLVFRLGEDLQYELTKNDAVIMECWAENGDYELTDTIQYELDIPLGTSRIAMDVGNSRNFELELLETSDLQDFSINKISDTKIYIDIISKKNTIVELKVGRSSAEEYTTIHRIAIRTLCGGMYELALSQEGTVFMDANQYIFNLTGEDLENLDLELEGTGIEIGVLECEKDFKTYNVLVPQNQVVSYGIQGDINKLDKMTCKIEK